MINMLKFIQKYWKWVVFSSLILIIIVQKECQRPCDPQIIVNDSIIKTVDSIPFEKVVYYPKPDTVYDSIPGDTVWRPLADSEMIADYNRVKEYSIPLQDDTAAKLTLDAKVYQNSLISAKTSGQIYQRHIYHYDTTFLKEKPRTKVYAGFQTGAMLPDRFVFAPGLVLQTKKDNMYSVAYDPINKAGLIGLYWKIRVKKPP